MFEESNIMKNSTIYKIKYQLNQLYENFIFIIQRFSF